MVHEEMNRRMIDIHEYMPVLRGLIEQGKEVSLTITGNSMVPFMVHGRDQVLIEKPSEPWKKGDIGFFQRNNGAYVLHRICHVDEQGNCWFVGDGQVMIEGPIRKEQIFGKVTAVKRKDKWVRPGSFLWAFFRYIWLWVRPLRPKICRIYVMFKRLVKLG